MKRGLVGFFVMLCLCLSAQPPRGFYRTIGGSGDDVGYSCKITLEGHYIVAGSTSSFGNNTDFYLVKVDSMGNTLWEKTYGGNGNEVARSVIQLQDSSFVVAGYTSSFGAGGYDIWVLRTDKKGNKIWDKTFGNSDWDFGTDIVLGSDNSLYIVGYTESYGAGRKDALIVKMDTTGTLIKYQTYGGLQNDEFRSMIKTNDNQLAAIGVTESMGDINGDIYFVKLSNNLDTVFTRRIGGNMKDYGNDLTQNTLNNEYYLCGAKTYTNYAKTRSYMYRMSATGNFVSDSNYYRNSIDESFISVCTSKITKYGMPLTAFARTVYFPLKNLQAETFVTLPAGNSFLINDSGLSEDEIIYSIEATKDGGFVSVGSTNGMGARGLDIYFIKQDSNIINYVSIVGIQESYLNPERNSLTLTGNKLILDGKTADLLDLVVIYDSQGNAIRSYTVKDFSEEIIIEDLNDGFFIFRFFYANGKSVTKKVFHVH